MNIVTTAVRAAFRRATRYIARCIGIDEIVAICTIPQRKVIVRDCSSFTAEMPVVQMHF